MMKAFIPLPDINEVVSALQTSIENVLGPHLLGIYIVGSLAVGDFDPENSDIDLIVVTDGVLTTSCFRALQAMHADFAQSSSLWAQKLEIVYAPVAALQISFKPLPGNFPQLEKGTALFSAPLEDGWVFQCWTLRERGLTVFGPSPLGFDIPTPPAAMAEAVRAVAAQWLHDAEHDPTWLPWLLEPGNQRFVVQTLCRLLYSLTTGEVTSKPHALAWGEGALGQPWKTLIARTLSARAESVDPDSMAATLAFIRLTHEAGRRGAIPNI